ncbi:MAG: hypothetical protein AB7F25_05175 [Deferribacterales bacterium]
MLFVHKEDKNKEQENDQYGHDDHFNGRLLFMLLVVVILGLLVKYMS